MTETEYLRQARVRHGAEANNIEKYKWVAKKMTVGQARL